LKLRLVVGLLVALAPAGCGDRSPSTAPKVELTVYAAASLKAALDQLRVAYEAVDPAVSLVITTDSSAALETKIEQGARADVFLSADAANPTKLVGGGFAIGPITQFASNTLVVIVPSDNPAHIATPVDMANAGVKVIAAGDEVPISNYAKVLVRNLGEQPGYPADFAARYLANVVSNEENVKAIVAKIELGQGDVAIVYLTDARASTSVKQIAVPEGANVLAAYAGVVVRPSPIADAAEAFLDWLTKPAAQAIFAAFGFAAPES
jgi:molybdate transport system substrate-binding protein